ncbi:WhiB family transcriptional regulator [Streptomyces sp. NPDC093093]|uniref:WhiB family transcriptional regulator n=1 Tax=Streptomyces sp. NPDC093093 TaxID=3366025 RepID=UPI00380BA206
MVTTAHRTPPASVQAVGSATLLPCQRRPDIFGQPLLTNPPANVTGPPLQTRRRQALIHAARQLCSSCPLWAECMRNSVARSDPGGYAGATTPQDRRWIRRKIGIGDAQGRLGPLPDGGGRPVEVAVVLDAFDALREYWASRPALASAGSSATGTRAGPGSDTRTDEAHRVAASGLPHVGQQRVTRVNTHEVSMAAPAGERITFSLDDPARAIQRAVLGPLVVSMLPTLDVTEQVAAMLARVPTAGLRPQLLDALRETRRCLDAWHTASGDEVAYRPAGSGLTGSVSVELATRDPLSALRQDIFEPLLHRLAESIRRIEVLTAALSAAPDGDTADGNTPRVPGVAAVHTALCELGAHIEQYAADAPLPQVPAWPQGGTRRDTPLRSVPNHASGSVSPPAPSSTPSLRQAVEQAVTSLPGPFTGRDVLLALPPGSYQDPAKSVSNALSAMAKSGRLLRVSRGMYAVAAPSSGTFAVTS